MTTTRSARNTASGIEWVTNTMVLRVGAALAPYPQQLEVQLVARHRVERPEGLVHQEQWRIEQQGPAERGSLLHASRQLAGPLVGEVVEADEPQQHLGAGPVAGRVEARQLGGQQHVVEDGPPSEQDRRLKDHPHGGNRTDDRAPVHGDATGRGRPQSRDDPQQRRLAAAGGADQGDQLTAIDRHADVAERLDHAGLGTIRHADAVERDQGLGGSIFVRSSLVKTSSHPTLRGMSGM